MKPCIHKTHKTPEKALSAWYRLGKSRRDNFTFYQCQRCLEWRVTSRDVLDKIIRESHDKPDRPKSKQWKPTVSKREAEFIAKGTGEDVQTVMEWLRARAISDRNHRLQEERFRKSAKLKAPPVPKAQPVTKAPVSPKAQKVTRPNRSKMNAARRLAKETMMQAIPEWARTPRKATGRRLSFMQALNAPFEKGTTQTTYEALTAEAIERYHEIGRDLVQLVIAGDERNVTKEDGTTLTLRFEGLIEYEQRDLRESKYHAQTDRRKPHRRPNRSRKPNRFLKVSPRGRAEVWRVLLSRLKKAHQFWKADVQNVLKMPFEERGRKLLF